MTLHPEFWVGFFTGIVSFAAFLGLVGRYFGEPDETRRAPAGTPARSERAETTPPEGGLSE